MEVYQNIGTPVYSINLFEDVIETIKDTWHKPDKLKQHISQLTACTKKTAKSQINPIKPNTSSRQAFYSGNATHKETGERYVMRFPMSVLEFPVEVIVLGPNGSKIKFKVTGKIDITDFGNSRIIDIKSSNVNAMRWIKTGSKKNPPGAKPSHIIQVVVYWYIWNYKIIRDPKSRYWIKDCAVIYVDWRYNDLYCPIPLDKYNAGQIYDDLIQEAIGVHKAVNLDDWVYLNDKWHYDKDYWLCKDYCDYKVKCQLEG